jgi:hypothetical protein
MTEPRKYKIYVATYSYGGNGGTRSEAKDLSDWLRGLDRKLISDPRISDVVYEDRADTPIPMVRNRTVMRARELGCDLVLMLDSDMKPDVELGRDPDAKPFWDTSFNFLDSMYETMPVVVGAPYCGGGGDIGGIENVFVFRWHNCVSEGRSEVDMQLEPYTRVEATMLSGILPVAALPTGCILYDVRIFDLVDPSRRYHELLNLGLTSSEAARATEHWFDYEWTDEFAAQKGSTEDVKNTRDLSLAGIQVYGSNPVFCNWDAWAGHWKPKLVGKPRLLTTDAVSNTLAAVVQRGNESGMKIKRVDFRNRGSDRTDAQNCMVTAETHGSDNQPTSSRFKVASP